MSFNPWAKSKKASLLSSLFGFALLYGAYLLLKNKIFIIIYGYEITPFMGSLVALFMALVFFHIAYNHIKRGRLSKYGLDVEENSVNAAVGLDWGDWRCWEDSNAYRGVGNIDMFVSNSSGEILTIEIKSWHKIKYDTDNLYYKDGKSIPKDPLSQALKQVEIVSGVVDVNVFPVLWLPKSYGKPIIVRGVLVVRGNAGTLKKILKGRF